MEEWSGEVETAVRTKLTRAHRDLVPIKLKIHLNQHSLRYRKRSEDAGAQMGITRKAGIRRRTLHEPAPVLC